MSISDSEPRFALRVKGNPRWVAAGDPPGSAGEPTTLLTIDADGRITVYSGKVEYGQGIRHGFSVEVADQLGVEPEDVNVVLSDTALVPWDRATVGSASTRTTGVQLARAAATARKALTQIAAEKLGVNQDDIQCYGGMLVSNRSRTSLSIAQLLADQERDLEIPDDLPIPTSDRAGSSVERSIRVDAVEKVTGRAIYTQDLQVDGMVHAKVIRPPSTGGKLQAIETSRAELVNGFLTLVREGDFVAVVAESPHSAERAAEAVRARWDEPSSSASDWSLPSLLLESAAKPVVLQELGSIDDVLASSDIVVESTYFAPYVANAQMEPSAAVASWDREGLTVWSASRGPFAERAQLSDSLDVPEEKIRVISQTVGGSFGTKTPTVSLEAARVARAVGRPVKVSYTRKEEFAWSTVRPAAVIQIKTGVSDAGDLRAWDYRAVNSGDNAFRGRRGAVTPYDAEGIHVSVAGSVSPLQYGSYRSLGGAVNHFAREAHMSRVARKLGLDPLEFRARNLSQPRYLRVLNTAAERFGWFERQRRDGLGFGIALGFDAGSYVAQCVEVEVSGREIAVRRVVVAFDCGDVINPEGVRNQAEGSIVMGMGTALWEYVEFDGGRVLTDGFGRYRVPRLIDTPNIEVVLIDDSTNPPTGAGEPGIVPIAAAIANAVADATGREVEQLPIEPTLT